VTGRQEPGEPLRNAVDRRRGGQLVLYLPAEGGHVRLDEDGEEAGQVHGQAHHCTRSRPLLSRTLTKEKHKTDFDYLIKRIMNPEHWFS
jgi:hypothetical protein